MPNLMFDSIHNLRVISDVYTSLNNVDEGRKIQFNQSTRTFSVSWGYNTGITWPVQMLNRILAQALGYDATAMATKVELEDLHDRTITYLKQLVSCVKENCLENDYIVTGLKTELAALRTIFQKTKEEITNLSKTYRAENDTSMADTTEREVGKFEILIKYVDDTLEELPKSSDSSQDGKQLFDSIHMLRFISDVYKTLNDVEEGRKVLFDDTTNKFSVSWGYSTGILWPIQAVNRLLAQLFGYNATAMGTKAELEDLHETTFIHLKQLVESVENRCAHSMYIVTSLKTELVALRDVFNQAREKIIILSESYRVENDTHMADTTKREAEKRANLIEYIDEILAKFSSAASSAIKGKEKPESETTNAENDAGRAKPEEQKVEQSPSASPRMLAAKKTSSSIVEKMKKMIQFLANTKTETVKDNFTTFFEKEGLTLEELEQIRMVRAGKREDVLEESRIGQERQLWIDLLGESRFDNELKAGFNLALDQAIRTKRSQRDQPPSFAASGKQNLLDELKSKVKQVNP